MLAAEAAAAESAMRLRATEEERGQLASQLTAAKAWASDKVVELQQAHDEISKLEQHVATAEATVATSQDELGKVQSEKSKCDERCQQLERRLTQDQSGNVEKLQSLLVENATYKERCEQLKANLSKAETKLEQMEKCQVEAARYDERCQLLERQLAEAKEQASCSSGFQASCVPEPDACDSGFVLVEDTSSVLSRSSWFSVQPHCFMLDSIFKTRSCDLDFFLMGRDLKKGSQVVAGDDETILEVAKNPEICKATEIVRLQAGEATLQVTWDHPVQVPDLKDMQKGAADVADEREGERVVQYLPAGTLKKGDFVVLDSREPMALTSVESWSADCEVLKIVFEPDLPVAVFSCPPCILSKGDKKLPKRRGRVSQRGKGAPDLTADSVSVPVTAREYMD